MGQPLFLLTFFGYAVKVFGMSALGELLRQARPENDSETANA
jgi:hypothetical protein